MEATLTKEEILASKREYYVVEPGERLDGTALFGNDRPLEIEIGCGKGEFIAAVALRHPERNFLGFELRGKRIDNILRKLDPARQPNVRLIRLLVDDQIGRFIPAGSIRRIYIQHPDPWPKRRHAKHRIIQQPFIDTLAYLLPPGGEVELTTDHPALRDWVISHFARRTDFESVHPGGYTFDLPEDHIRTYFDVLHEQDGYPPAWMVFRKRSES
jgi:tRNA (guanine-N7-)-methyltransferase